MAILQISKIQQRSGNLVDLPQLDEAEFGWASDAKRLFIGKTTPNENIEILTSYSQISFSQIDGAAGNLNISNVTIAEGQVLTYDGTDWVNRGGQAGGLITLGDVSNVKITGGGTGYVLQTDGTGNLSWTPKGTLVAGVLNVSKANPAVVTTVDDNFFSNGTQVTITDPQGMIELAGNIFYANLLTANTFELYTDDTLLTPVDSSLYTDYSYTTVSATTVSTNVITVADATVFSEGQAVRFIGNLSTSGLENNVTYYVANAVSTTLKVATSSQGNLQANVVPLQTTSGLTAEVYAIDGQAVASISSGVAFSAAGGANTQIQYNGPAGALTGSSAFTYDYGNSILTLVGNANIGNVSINTASSIGTITANVFVSNIANGTPPLTVTSVTRVSNLNVSYANVSDFAVVTSQTTGTFYPVFVSSSSTGNRALGANANISFNASTGNLSVPLLSVTANAGVTGNLNVTANANVTANVNANNINVSNAISSNTATVTGNIIAGNVYANSGTIGASLLTGTLTTAAQPNITSVGTLTSLTISGNLTAGNISGNIVAGSNPISTTGNATVGNLNTSGTVGGPGATLYGNTLTTGANTTTGTIIGTWTLTAGSSLQATYADLAEYYEADTNYEPGTVLMFGGEKEVTIAEDGTNKVAGVVSSNPAYLMNNDCPGNKIAIALQGRVPVKVRGKINKGDMMVSGGNGFARPSQFPTIGSIIGKAIEDFDGYEGVIEVAIGRL